MTAAAPIVTTLLIAAVIVFGAMALDEAMYDATGHHLVERGCLVTAAAALLLFAGAGWFCVRLMRALP